MKMLTPWRARHLVRNAAFTLDELTVGRFTPGWASHVNTEMLDISSVDRCVLGQLFGDYYAGGVAADMRFTHGRALHPGKHCGASWLYSIREHLLRHAWKREISARRRDLSRPRYATFDAPATSATTRDVSDVQVMARSQ